MAKKIVGSILFAVLASALLLNALTPVQAAPPVAKIRYDAKIDLDGGDSAYVINPKGSKTAQLVLSRWQDECTFTIDAPIMLSGAPLFDGSKYKWSTPQADIRIYRLIEGKSEYGDIEFDIILKSQPISNAISFPISMEGLIAHYQPPLTPEEIADGVERPDDVVGSYAIYHTTKMNIYKTDVEAEKYRAGKAFHIYRPKVKDAIGNETWAGLNLTDSVLTITVNKDWLAKATYPVVVDPTFGVTSVGASTLTIEDLMHGLLATCPEACDATKMTAYTYSTYTTKGAKCAIYDGTTKVQETDAITNNFVEDWKDFNFSVQPSLSNQNYYLAIAGASGTSKNYVRFDTDASYDSRLDAITYPTFPDPAVWGTDGNRKISIYCTYTAGPSPPTVTSQAATNVEDTTATGNGNITATGGENCDRRGIVWDLASHGDPGNVAPGASGYANDVGTNGSFGTGAFTESLTGLPTGDTIYYRAYAHNSAGYDYSNTEQSFLTKPAAPTNIAATDGVHENKVVVTWTKSTGATGYKIYRDAGLIDTVGDVATYDDVGATAGTITNAGTASASDGTSVLHVTLSLAGEATGTTSHTYKLRATNATGDSGDSATDTGYRGVGAITYQWQVDSGGGFGNIAGGTTDPYNYTGASAPTITPGAADASDGTSGTHVTLSVSGESGNNGATWDYRCIVSASGASNSPQTSTSDTGYRGSTTLTYVWHRSWGDADADFSSMAGEGGTTDPYNDINGAVDPSGRYYYATVSMTGAASQDTTHDRGYISAAGAGPSQWWPIPLLLPFPKSILRRKKK